MADWLPHAVSQMDHPVCPSEGNFATASRGRAASVEIGERGNAIFSVQDPRSKCSNRLPAHAFDHGDAARIGGLAP